MHPAAPGRRLDPAGPAPPGSEDYLEVSIPMDKRTKHCGKGRERKETDYLEASRPAWPLAVVLPAEVPCENPGEIFILLKDEVVGETLEVEFTSDNKCTRTQPAYWSKNVWSMEALDFPAGSVTVNVYCDGIMKATTEIKYCTKAMECPVRMPDPGDVLCQNHLEELDGVLTSMFKHEMLSCGFTSLQTEVYPQKQDTQVQELPTLLHCAAKLGLKRLAIQLLQCSGAAGAAKGRSIDGLDLAHVAERHGHRELKKIFEDFTIQEIGRNNAQENDYEEDIVAFSPSATQLPIFHHENNKTHTLHADGAEPSERARQANKNESSAEARHSPAEIGSGCPEDQYDDLYVFIPGTDSEINPQETLVCCRPPLPPPRPVPSTSLLERPHITLQAGKIVEGQMERSQNWIDFSTRQESRDEPGDIKNEDGKEQEEDEDPYTCAEADDNEYALILANMSMKKSTGGRSFILNRPPAPTPRPTRVPDKEQTVPYIAQVFQQKAARRQCDNDKSCGVPKKPGKARIESPTLSIPRDYLTSGQEELILLQEKVKNGKMSMDEALEKFKHWQMEKSDLEMIQQEKLRQLRDNIIGKRPEEENVYDKLTIVHHPSGNTTHNENKLHSIPCSNKLPSRLQVEKELGFCCKKDH